MFARVFRYLMLLAALPCMAVAADKPAYKRWYQFDYTIRSAELIDVTQRIETEVTSESLVQLLGQQRVTNNDNFFDLEIVEAATIKPDGHRIDVQRDQIAVLSGAEATTNILFQADSKTHVVPFPDLAAGDRTIIVVRTIQKQPISFGGNEIALVFPPSFYFTVLNITVRSPRQLPLKISERALRHETEMKDDLQVLSWRLDEQTYAAIEANSTAPVDWAPMLMLSTFQSWESIGKAEFSVADPKSQPDDQVRALAESITSGLTDRRAQAAAIFDWVATNIRYYQIVLRQGGFVPHEVDQILKNRYGDCKDHATLMRALLRSKGINSDYVLINVQLKIYRAFEIPVMNFDHMILYLPEFAIYADPTVPTANLGMLPLPEYDRPVLRFGPDGAIWTRTPALAADDLKAELATEATIAEDGQVSGTNIIRATGPLAIELRNAMSLIEQNGSAIVAKAILTKQRWAGSAAFDVHSPFERGEMFEIRSHFELTSKLFGDNVRPSAVPTGPRIFSRPLGPFSAVVKEDRKEEYVCFPVSYSESVRLKLPSNKRLASLPKDKSVTRPLGEYQSSYRMEGDTLVVLRKIKWRPPSFVCTPQMAHEVSDISQAIEHDTASRLIFLDAGQIVTPPTERDNKEVVMPTPEVNMQPE